MTKFRTFILRANALVTLEIFCEQFSFLHFYSFQNLTENIFKNVQEKDPGNEFSRI